MAAAESPATEINVIMEESTYGKSQQNGLAERVLWEVEGMAHTLFDGTETSPPPHHVRVTRSTVCGHMPEN